MNKKKLLEPASIKTDAFFRELTGYFKTVGYDPIDPESDLVRAQIITDLKAFLKDFDITFMARDKPIDFLREVQKVARRLEALENFNLTDPTAGGVVSYLTPGGIRYVEMKTDADLGCKFDDRAIIRTINSDGELAKQGVKRYDQLIAAGGLTPPKPFKREWLLKQFKAHDSVIPLQFAPYNTKKSDKEYAMYRNMGLKASIQDILSSHREMQNKAIKKNEELLQKIQQQKDLGRTIDGQLGQTDGILGGGPPQWKGPASNVIVINPTDLKAHGFTTGPSIGIELNCAGDQAQIRYHSFYHKPEGSELLKHPTWISKQNIISSTQVDRGELVESNGNVRTFPTCKGFTQGWLNYLASFNISADPGVFKIYLKPGSGAGGIIGTMNDLRTTADEDKQWGITDYLTAPFKAAGYLYGGIPET